MTYLDQSQSRLNLSLPSKLLLQLPFHYGVGVEDPAIFFVVAVVVLFFFCLLFHGLCFDDDLLHLRCLLFIVWNFEFLVNLISLEHNG